MKWIKVYYYLQPWKNIGPLIRMVVAIFLEMPAFLLLMTIDLIATGSAFYLLVQAESVHGYENFGASYFSMYQMLFLGNYDEDVFAGHYDIILKSLFVLSTILCSILLLNLLIARMADSCKDRCSRRGRPNPLA